jgi:hypothetical protein
MGLPREMILLLKMIFPVIPTAGSFRILDKKRTDTNELTSREASISVPARASPPPRRISVRGRTSSVKSIVAVNAAKSSPSGGPSSSLSSSYYFDSPTFPMERTSSPEPINPSYGCDGFCCPNQDDGPYIVSSSLS